MTGEVSPQPPNRRIIWAKLLNSAAQAEPSGSGPAEGPAQPAGVGGLVRQEVPLRERRLDVRARSATHDRTDARGPELKHQQGRTGIGHRRQGPTDRVPNLGIEMSEAPDVEEEIERAQLISREVSDIGDQKACAGDSSVLGRLDRLGHVVHAHIAPSACGQIRGVLPTSTP